MQVTEAEWDVMLAVWQQEEQVAGEIIDRVLQTRDWNHRTIRTLIARLVDKGAIEVRVEAGKHFYRAAISKEACVRSAARSFRDRFFSGDVASLLVHFVENENMSKQQRDELRRLLDEKSPATKKRGRRR